MSLSKRLLRAMPIKDRAFNVKKKLFEFLMLFFIWLLIRLPTLPPVSVFHLIHNYSGEPNWRCDIRALACLQPSIRCLNWAQCCWGYSSTPWWHVRISDAGRKDSKESRESKSFKRFMATLTKKWRGSVKFAIFAAFCTIFSLWMLSFTCAAYSVNASAILLVA